MHVEVSKAGMDRCQATSISSKGFKTEVAEAEVEMKLHHSSNHATTVAKEHGRIEFQ